MSCRKENLTTSYHATLSPIIIVFSFYLHYKLLGARPSPGLQRRPTCVRSLRAPCSGFSAFLNIRPSPSLNSNISQSSGGGIKSKRTDCKEKKSTPPSPLSSALRRDLSLCLFTEAKGKRSARVSDANLLKIGGRYFRETAVGVHPQAEN